jgi:hypothetical protein
LSIWRRKSYETEISQQPSIDHTTLAITGYYLQIFEGDGLTNENALIKSPFMHDSSPTCIFEFWYQIFGTLTGILEVHLEIGNEKFSLLILNDRTPNKEWKKSSVIISKSF